MRAQAISDLSLLPKIFKELEENHPPVFREFIEMEFRTAFRPGDVQLLQYKHFVNRDHGQQIVIKEEKTGKTNYREMTQPLIDIVERCKSRHRNMTGRQPKPTDYLFIPWHSNRASNNKRMKPVTARSVNRILLKVQDVFGFHMSHYTFRKTMSKFVLDQSDDIREVQQLLNHSDQRTTENYLGKNKETSNSIAASIGF